MERLRVDGKFLRLGEERVFLKMVTYGPLPGGWTEDFGPEFQKIRQAGFDAIRLYSWPDHSMLDAAQRAGLRVFAGLEWPQAEDFFRTGALETATRSLKSGLLANGSHPALAGVFVANEIPTDLVRWMDPERVQRALELLIDEGREQAPELIWTYANYPSSEFLEPGNADVTSMNVYLEEESAFRSYLKRLHHIAGDRPLIISEFGLDTQRGGEPKQAESLAWAIRACRDHDVAAMSIYAWTDRWWNNGAEVLDWDFGLTDRSGHPKAALSFVTQALEEEPATPSDLSISVIVCTRNGRTRIAKCLRSLEALKGPEPEIIVVDDGSIDGTGDFVASEFPQASLLRLDAQGLSAARNAGAEAAHGEILAFTDDDCEADPDWLTGLARQFDQGWDAVGGPNLPPEPRDATEAIVAAAPGAASHVMLDDTEAEHIPGCNLAVKRSVYFEIGGFDPDFRTAGDDVDFCWRLRDAGHRIGFAPGAFVWHDRRPTLEGYLRQQTGYGHAEAMLMRKHPARFSPSGDARWHGTIYTGAPVRVSDHATIYHGPMGLAGYQEITLRMQPLRDLTTPFDNPWARGILAVIIWLAPRLRSRARIGRFRGPVASRVEKPAKPDAEFALWSEEGRENVLEKLLASGWTAGGATDDWDVEKNGTRLLIACERHDHGHARLLIRVWGNFAEWPELAQAEAI